MNTRFKALQIKRQYIVNKYVVGIDPAKAKHQASIFDCHGIISGKSFTFSNSFAGYQTFLKKSKAANSRCQCRRHCFCHRDLL